METSPTAAIDEKGLSSELIALRGKMLGKSFGALLTMLLLPLVMFIAVYFVGFFFQLLSAAMNAAIGTTGGDTEIANIIHNICIPIEAGIKEDKPVTNWNISYRILEGAGINSDYNYVLGMLTCGIMVYVLITICYIDVFKERNVPHSFYEPRNG